VVPPAGARRLNLILAGKPAGRISLDRATAKPATTMTGTVLTPGERYLHGIACRLLCGDPPTRGIGAAIDALLAADALAADSAVPGQLAALCERLQFTDHGIDAAPAAELPGRWLSVLTGDRRPASQRQPRLRRHRGHAARTRRQHDHRARPARQRGANRPACARDSPRTRRELHAATVAAR
jgi:hypothetical protein